MTCRHKLDRLELTQLIEKKEKEEMSRWKIPAAAMAIASLAFGTAVNADAATYRTVKSNGCTVRYSSVTHTSDHVDGSTRVWFNVKLSCKANRQIRYESRLWEQDTPPDKDDLVGQPWGPTKWIDASNKEVSHKFYWPVASSYDSPNDRWGEFYQRLRIQVRVNGENPFPWTAYKNSTVQKVFI